MKQGSQPAYDLIALGEPLVRLSPPGHGRIALAPMLEVYVGGAEYNVAYACANLGLRCAFVSTLPDNPVAQIVLRHARAAGLDVSPVRLTEYDGVGRTGRVGLTFTEVGTGGRPTSTMYDRGHSAAASMSIEDLHTSGLPNMRARWFHTGAVMAAAASPDLVREALLVAGRQGMTTSYDLNYRSAMWASSEALAANRALMPYVNVLTGSRDAFRLGLGITPRTIHSPANAWSEAQEVIEETASANPSLEVIAITLRQTEDDHTTYAGLLLHEGRLYRSKEYPSFVVEDRVGAGDAFTAGVIFALLGDRSPQQVVNFGVGLGSLVQTVRGDNSQFSEQDVLSRITALEQ